VASVTLKNLSKRFGKVTAVQDVSLEIRDGEFVVLLGPSGCGKSTMLYSIAGLETISGGQIFIGDRLMNRVPPKARNIAMVFQDYALYPHMNVYNNMAFGLKLRKISSPEIQQRVQEAAAMLSIEHLLQRRPRELSGGQRQRVALGRAIVREPDVFLMDEPLSNLDAILRAQMRTEIARLHHRLNSTFIYVTHDQVEAITMGDRIVVLKDGIIQQVGSPQEVYERPNNVFVGGFIGTPAMNFLRGTVSAREGSLVLDTGDFSVPLSGTGAEQAAAYKGKTLIAGVRPSAIALVDQSGESAPPAGAIAARVDVVEPMGDIAYIQAFLAGQLFTVRADPLTLPSAGQTVLLRINGAALHLFDGESQQSILKDRPVSPEPAHA
jgi:multiple sugar transport system ATP-binding protein